MYLELCRLAGEDQATRSWRVSSIYFKESNTPQGFFYPISRLDGGTSCSHHPRERPLMQSRKASDPHGPPESPRSPPPSDFNASPSKLQKVLCVCEGCLCCWFSLLPLTQRGFPPPGRISEPTCPASLCGMVAHLSPEYT